jgi:hypothetical protein
MAFAVVPVSVVAAAAMISQSSYGAFSATTRNSGNNWRTGSVSLTDDDTGSARFNVTNMVPEQTETKCIKVTSFASVPGTVKFYLLNAVRSPQHLEDHIMFNVRAGDGGGFGSCVGFVSSETVGDGTLALGMDYSTSYASGAGSWVTAGISSGESKTYEITWKFESSTLTQQELDALQGASTGVDVQWELQSNSASTVTTTPVSTTVTTTGP